MRAMQQRGALLCVACRDYAAEPYGWIVDGRRLCAQCGGDDRRLPSHVTDAYWVYAVRQGYGYPPRTARGGKWLFFIPNEHIDEAWATIKEATEEGLLGDSSKVATARPNPHETSPHTKVICVYTYDGDDRADVGRILEGLRDLSFKGRLFWKADAATRSGLYSGAGRRVSRYSSDDFE
jgi:hypothetical protein